MLLITLWSVLGAGDGPRAWPTLSTSPPDFLPAPILYSTISPELKLADLKLQSVIGSEVFTLVPLHSKGEARPTFPVSYMWLASILKIPRNNSMALSEFSGKYENKYQKSAEVFL